MLEEVVIVSQSPLNPLAKLLLDERERQNLSQSELARRAGLSATYIRQIEIGQNPSTGRPISPSLERLAALAKGLRLPMQRVLDAAQASTTGMIYPTNYDAMIRAHASHGNLTNRNESPWTNAGLSSAEHAYKATGSTPSGKRIGSGTEVTQGGEAPFWVPVYGPVAAGEPIMWTSEDALGLSPIPPSWAGKCDAVFVIAGDSVSDYGVRDGSEVYVKRINGEPLVAGDMVVVESEGAYFCKIYREAVVDGAVRPYLESHEEGKAPMPFFMPGDVNVVARVVGWPMTFRRRT